MLLFSLFFKLNANVTCPILVVMLEVTHYLTMKEADRMKKIILLFLILLIGGASIVWILTNQEDETKSSNPASSSEKTVEEDKNRDDINTVENLTEEKVVEVLNSYREAFESLISDTNDQNFLSSFYSIDEVRGFLTKVMSTKQANEIIGNYVENRDRGVYFIAKESPVFFEKDTDFTFKKVTKKHYKVIQQQENQMRGKIEKTFHVTWVEDKWILDNVEVERLEAVQPNVEQLAQEVIQVINKRDMEALAVYAHKEKGVLFSPYVHVKDQHQEFTKEEIANFKEDETVYHWGNYDGSGKPIELTPLAYFNEFLNVEKLQEPDEIFVNQYNQHGNAINNHKEQFPNTKIIEYHVEGTEENAKMDWQSIHLVFEKNDNELWKLTAIISDTWTI